MNYKEQQQQQNEWNKINSKKNYISETITEKWDNFYLFIFLVVVCLFIYLLIYIERFYLFIYIFGKRRKKKWKAS